jgi:hypothetical protein
MPVRLATFKGSGLFSSVVTAFSLGNPGVHTEVWFNEFRISTFERRKGCVSVLLLDDSIDMSDWYLTDIPVTDPLLAFRFIEEAVRSPATYNYSVPEFALPKSLLNRIDPDLDCQRPHTWNRLFCSQFALLFLRRCAMAGILDVDYERVGLLWGVNSKGCLPARLKIIAERIFTPCQK